MDFLELTKKRFSARNYKSDKVEQDKIDYIIECARLAPSAVNYQPWHFLVVISEEQKQKVRQCYNRDWFAMNLKHGYGNQIIKIMLILMLLLLQNMFALLLQRWDQAVVGYVISIWIYSDPIFSCHLKNIRQLLYHWVILRSSQSISQPEKKWQRQ